MSDVSELVRVCAWVIQVPIWKKEIYDGAAPEWKENKESAAPTVGQMMGATRRKHAALSVAVGAAALALVVRWAR